MPFIIIAYFAHVLENTLIAFIIKDTGPYIYIPLFYAISTALVFFYEKALNHRKEKTQIDWNNILSHKGALTAYIGGAFLGNSLWFFSIYMIGIGTVAFILIFIRLFVAIYAYLFMDDRYPADKMAAFATAFFALIFFSYNGLENNWAGITVAFLSCIFFSAESIGKKKLALSDLKPESMVLWRYSLLTLLFCFIFVTLNSLNLIPEDMLQVPSLSSLLLICLASFMGSIGTNVALFYGLKTVSLSTLEALNTTKPVLFALIGVSFLNENISTNQMLWGIVIVLASIYFVLPRKLHSR